MRTQGRLKALYAGAGRDAIAALAVLLLSYREEPPQDQGQGERYGGRAQHETEEAYFSPSSAASRRAFSFRGGRRIASYFPTCLLCELTGAVPT